MGSQIGVYQQLAVLLQRRPINVTGVFVIRPRWTITPRQTRRRDAHHLAVDADSEINIGRIGNVWDKSQLIRHLSKEVLEHWPKENIREHLIGFVEGGLPCGILIFPPR